MTVILTACGYINDRQHTGATQSIIPPDVVKALSNVRLRIATGESATVHGKTDANLTIGNISVRHVFIIADIVREVITGADFMIAHGINLKMKQQIMS